MILVFFFFFVSYLHRGRREGRKAEGVKEGENKLFLMSSTNMPYSASATLVPWKSALRWASSVPRTALSCETMELSKRTRYCCTRSSWGLSKSGLMDDSQYRRIWGWGKALVFAFGTRRSFPVDDVSIGVLSGGWGMRENNLVRCSRSCYRHHLV